MSVCKLIFYFTFLDVEHKTKEFQFNFFLLKAIKVIIFQVNKNKINFKSQLH